MLRYYLSVLRHIPDVARNKTELVMFWAAIVVSVLAFARPDLVKNINEAMTRTASLVVLFVALGYATLRANYAKYQNVDKLWKEAHSVILSDRARSAQQTALGNLRNRYLAVMSACVIPGADVHELRRQLNEIDSWAFPFVEQHFNGGEASLLNQDAVPDLDLNARALAAEGNDELAKVYVEAQHKAHTLGRLIAASRPVISAALQSAVNQPT